MHKYSQLLTTLRFAWIALALWSLLSPWSQAQQLPLRLGSDVPLQRLVDPSGQMGINDIAALPPSAFTPQQRPISEGYTRQVVWLRIDLPQSPATAQPLWLEAGPTYLDHIDLYQFVDGRWVVQRNGDRVPASQRLMPRPLVFHIEPGQPLYLRIATTSALQLFGSVHNNASLQAELARQSWAMGITVGMGSSMVAALFVAARGLRSRQLMALALLGLVALLHSLITRGYAALWLPDHWTPWGSHLVGVGALTLSALAAWQVREQLTRRSRWRRADQFLTALIALNLVSIVSIPLDEYPRIAWLGVVSPVLSSTLATCLCWQLRSERIGQILGLGYGIHAAMGAVIALAFVGMLKPPINTGTIWTLEVVLFALVQSTAILLGMVQAYRKNQEERASAMKALEDSEQALEHRVHARTAELLESRQTLNQVLEHERQMRHEQRHFFNMISHEFRTPLAIVDSAATEQLSFPSADLAEQRERATQIRRACKRLTALIDNCLISDRMDSESFRLLPGPADLPDLTQDAAQLVHWSPKHALQLQLASAPDHWVCDATLVRIALSNLADNAVKYANAGTISIHGQLNADGLLEISVTDTGPGISPETLQRMFQRFERGQRSDQTRGFGLGLWVARRIARLHGGDVNVESGPQGTCFKLTLAPQSQHRPAGAATALAA